MIIQRGKMLNMWREALGAPHYLYVLIDPRTDEICYVGITKQNFRTRLSQHRNPINTNMASIAKLQRHLKSKGLTLGGEVLAKGSENFISVLEKYIITGYWRYLGKGSIKNHQIGGRDAFGLAPESKQKAWITRNNKKKEGLHKYKKGEDSPSNKITEKQVIEIYNLIKKFYTNIEIIKILDLDIGATALNQIRNGLNWKHLWEQESMIKIPSLNVVEGALNSQDKLKVLELVEEGKTNREIKENFKLNSTDIDRIRNKTLWKMAWNVYENYYKPLKINQN